MLLFLFSNYSVMLPWLLVFSILGPIIEKPPSDSHVCQTLWKLTKVYKLNKSVRIYFYITLAWKSLGKELPVCLPNGSRFSSLGSRFHNTEVRKFYVKVNKIKQILPIWSFPLTFFWLLNNIDILLETETIPFTKTPSGISKDQFPI